MADAHRVSPAHAGTLKRWLGSHTFFSQLADEDYRHAEGHAALVETVSDAPLLSEGDTSPFAWFLLEGGATLRNADDYEQQVSHTDDAAGYPLAHLRPARYTLVPQAGARFVRFEQAFVKKVAAKPQPVRFLGGTEAGGGSWQSHPFAVEVERLRREGELSVPAMPGVSARIGQAMQDPDFAMSDLARLIGADPAIAGELVKVSNSALFRAAGVCETLQAAIVRLGLAQTQTLVLSLAARSMFTARIPWVKQRLTQMWRHAVEVGAYMTVLAQLSPAFDASKSLLAGLLHEIGAVPVLALADRYADLEQLPGVVDSVLANVVPEFSSEILTAWGLNDFAEAALQQENWFYEHEGEANYTDLLVVAHLYGLIKARRFKDLPQLSQAAPYGRLMQFGLSASMSVDILDNAQQELHELRVLLG